MIVTVFRIDRSTFVSEIICVKNADNLNERTTGKLRMSFKSGIVKLEELIYGISFGKLV